MVLVTDLYEGGDSREMRKKFVSLVNSGVQLIVLPALNMTVLRLMTRGMLSFSLP